jgi:hypothetical protein
MIIMEKEKKISKDTEEWLAKLPEGDREMVLNDMTEHCDVGDHATQDVRSCFVCGYSACFGHRRQLEAHMDRLKEAEKNYPMAKRFKKMWFKLRKLVDEVPELEAAYIELAMKDIEDEMLYDGIPIAVNLEEDLKRAEEKGLVNIDGDSFSLTTEGIDLMTRLAEHMPPEYLECAKAARRKVEQEEEEWYEELGRTPEAEKGKV